jgi:hypothetical protein
MMSGRERSGRNADRTAALRAITNIVLKQMQTSGWNPVRLRGHSRRYRVTIPEQGAVTVAIKMAGRRYPGAMGWAQKRGAEWSTPLTDTDFILYATPYGTKLGRGLGVWMFPTEAVLERLEVVQELYDERGWGRLVSLWINIFEQSDRPNMPPCQVNFAEGAPPMWLLPFPATTAEDENADEPAGPQPSPSSPGPLTIPEAKAGLALGLGVPEAAIEITVKY